MRYKITTLYDSPEVPIGTVYRVKEIYKNGEIAYLEYSSEAFPYLTRGPVDKFDNPKFYKKEIDDEWISDMVCPKCGSTKGLLFSEDYHVHDIDSNNYGCNYSVGIECICGHKRVIYGTNFGRKILKSIYGIKDK